MKRLASRLTWWHMLAHKSTPRSTPAKGERPAMDHVGIDVHKRESQIYILAEVGGDMDRRRRQRTLVLGRRRFRGRRQIGTRHSADYDILALPPTIILPASKCLHIPW
jgi:hypothetical protein